MDGLRVYVSTHKDCFAPDLDTVQLIQVGAANSKFRFKQVLYDDQGVNISELNPMYCELTAQYWAWKNETADFYGFCHYRRYFSLMDHEVAEDSYGNVIEPYLSNKVLDKYGFNDKNLKDLISNYDLITTKRNNVRKFPGKYKNIYDHWKRAPYLHDQDIDIMVDIIKNDYPKYYTSAVEYCNGYLGTFCNMYILRKDLFFEYCDFAFGVLEKFCEQKDMSLYSKEALRTPGHLAERLFGIYYTFIMNNRKDIRCKELQCVCFKNTDRHEALKPAFIDAKPIVFAANDGFVPYFAACLQSLLDCSSSKNNYDIVLLHKDICESNQKLLLEMVRGFDNVSLRFYNVGFVVGQYSLKANAHISEETYYRFLIQDVLPDYDEILYLDCDIIICTDVAKIFDEDLTGFYLAATRDPDFAGQINGANKKTIKYINSSFHMNDPHNYFQAGVILFNIKEMKEAYSTEEWLQFASTPYMYNDQDVLNLYCEGKVKYLDMKWNLLADCDHTRISKVISFAPNSIQNEYFEARKCPYIIHYAGFMKPWHRPTEDYAERFWSAIRKTPFYEKALFTLMNNVSFWGIYENNKRHGLKGIIYKTKRVIIKTGNVLFPKGTRRRMLVKRIIKRQ